jgi:hydrogenase maturation protease
VSRTLVIGIGSPFEGDRIGWDVIDLMSSDIDLMNALGEGAELLKLDRPGSGLIERINGAARVILIDALQLSVEGDLLSLKAEELVGNNCLVSSHGFGVAEALGLASAMQVMPEQLEIFGLSPGVEAGVALEKIKFKLLH